MSVFAFSVISHGESGAKDVATIVNGFNRKGRWQSFCGKYIRIPSTALTCDATEESYVRPDNICRLQHVEPINNTTETGTEKLARVPWNIRKPYENVSNYEFYYWTRLSLITIISRCNVDNGYLFARLDGRHFIFACRPRLVRAKKKLIGFRLSSVNS